MKTAIRHDGRVPNFFQNDDEAAAREQVRWLVEHKLVSLKMISGMIGLSKCSQLSDWQAGKASLGRKELETLGQFWIVIRHVLNLESFEVDRARNTLNVVSTMSASGRPTPFQPPWLGLSLSEYLKRGGYEAIKNANNWLTALRFSDYPADTQGEAYGSKSGVRLKHPQT